MKRISVIILTLCVAVILTIGTSDAQNKRIGTAAAPEFRTPNRSPAIPAARQPRQRLHRLRAGPLDHLDPGVAKGQRRLRSKRSAR